MKQEKINNVIKFSYYHEGIVSEGFYGSPETKIEYEIDAETNIHEVCQCFENFLLACGYRLKKGENVRIVEDYD
jgi:hypothetical protein